MLNKPEADQNILLYSKLRKWIIISINWIHYCHANLFKKLIIHVHIIHVLNLSQFLGHIFYLSVKSVKWFPSWHQSIIAMILLWVTCASWPLVLFKMSRSLWHWNVKKIQKAFTGQWGLVNFDIFKIIIEIWNWYALLIMQFYFLIHTATNIFKKW